jgi:hypothetical protein
MVDVTCRHMAQLTGEDIQRLESLGQGRSRELLALRDDAEGFLQGMSEVGVRIRVRIRVRASSKG